MKRTLSLLLAILTILSASACASSTIPKVDPSDSSVLALTSNEEAKGLGSEQIEEQSAEPSTSIKDIEESSDATSNAEMMTPETTVADEKEKDDSSPAETKGKETDTSKTPETTKSPETPKTPDTGKNSGSSETPSQPSTEPEKPKDTTPKTEPPAETTKPQEPEPPAPKEPEKPVAPKSAYDFEFDITQIRKDLIALGKGYGLTLDESLTPNNASWANPVFATKSTQGDRLKRLLIESVQYYADKDYRASMGLSDLGLTTFNIYCESLGNGEYRIYFLNY